MIDKKLFKQRALNNFRRAFAESFSQLSRIPMTCEEDYTKQDELHVWLTNIDCAMWETAATQGHV